MLAATDDGDSGESFSQAPDQRPDERPFMREHARYPKNLRRRIDPLNDFVSRLSVGKKPLVVCQQHLLGRITDGVHYLYRHAAFDKGPSKIGEPDRWAGGRSVRPLRHQYRWAY